MKKILCLLLIFILCLSLCACEDTLVDDNGVERQLIYGRFVIIGKDWDCGMHVVYEKTTKIVYYLQSRSGFMSPYIIYTMDGLCGAIYAKGEIRPIPYSICVNEDTIHHLINSAFGSP